ncbi:MAG TPA: Rne/Rng family ribonuclease [Burkholderiales bacterium]|nr:Rne/Rng family ribonuclease [Burkholderiales bacterium]
MKRMLFNATQAEELRVAIVDGQKLLDLDIESASKEQRKGNIYKGIVTRIEPGLEAAFVNYGSERHGFLPFKEITRSYFKRGVDVGRARIQDAIEEGQELIVQVDKDERGTKGAALTTFISLAGRYLVLMPNNPRGGGVSRRVEGEERTELREAVDQLEVPQGMSVIARTAGIGRNTEELNWDLNYLLQLWREIESASQAQRGAFLIYQESSLVIRAIRDHFHQDIGEILIDTEDIYEQARAFMGHVMPQNVSRVKLYHDEVPLFSRFQIEHQIETAFSRQVSLPSGGAIVIDHTEALVSIDVNSARATRGADIEETALRTNLEAVDEVARQLRLRDLGGLIVIDFIDMENVRNQRDVENRLRDALHDDRARVQMGKISRFGLMELSRQRLRPALAETNHIPCPRCHGTGHIRSIESTALHILRILQEEAMKENTGAVHAQVPVDVATYLLNEKRAEFHAIESRLKVNVVLIPNIHLETPNYTVTRLRHEELNQANIAPPSYEMANAPEKPALPTAQSEPPPPRQQAVVKAITPAKPAPVVEPRPSAEPAGPSLLGKIFGWFKSSPAPVEKTAKQETRAPSPASRRNPPPRRDARERTGRSDDKRWQQRQPRDAQKRESQPQRPPHSAPQPAEGARAEAARENAQQRREGAPGRRRRSRRGRHESPREAAISTPQEQLFEQSTAAAVTATPAMEIAPSPLPAAMAGPDTSWEEPGRKEQPAPETAPETVSAVETVFHPAEAPVGRPAETVVMRESPQFLPAVEEPPPQRAAEIEAQPPAPTQTDLMQIETDPTKTKSVVEPPETQPLPPRTPRVRPAPPPVNDEPLQQVETRSTQ